MTLDEIKAKYGDTVMIDGSILVSGVDYGYSYVTTSSLSTTPMHIVNSTTGPAGFTPPQFVTGSVDPSDETLSEKMRQDRDYTTTGYYADESFFPQLWKKLKFCAGRLK